MSTELTEVNILEAFAQSARMHYKDRTLTNTEWQAQGIKDFKRKTLGFVSKLYRTEKIKSPRELTDILVEMNITNSSEADNFLEALDGKQLEYSSEEYLLIEKVGNAAQTGYRIRDITTNYG